MQWHWWSANSCIPAGDYGCFKDILQSNGYWVNSKLAWWTVGAGSCSGPTGPNGHSGCGEQFWNCADIKVLPGNGGPIITKSTTQAPAATTTEAMSTAAPTAAATTVLPSSTCRVVNGAADFGATASRCNAACRMLPEGHWPCGVGHACDCVSMETTTGEASSTMPASSTVTETMPETTMSTTIFVSTTEAGTVRCFKTLCNRCKLCSMYHQDELALQWRRLDGESTQAHLHLHRVAGRSVEPVSASEKGKATDLLGNLAASGWCHDRASRSFG